MAEENASNMASEVSSPPAEGLGEVLVKRYAQAAGVDEDTARRVLEALRERRPSRFERIKAMLELMGEYRDKVDPTLLPIIRPLIVQELTASTAGNGIGERIARAIEEVSAAKLAVEAAGRVLGGQPQQVPEQVLKSLESLSRAVEELKKKVEGEEENQTLQLLSSLQQQIQQLQGEIQNLKQGGVKTGDEIEELAKKLEERKRKAQEFLKALGYDVREGELPPEKVKELAERYGFKVVEAKVSLEELEKAKREFEEKARKLAEEAYRRGREEAQKEFDEKMLEKQIGAVERIVQTAVDRVVSQIIAPIVQGAVTGFAQQSQQPAEQPKPPRIVEVSEGGAGAENPQAGG